MRIADKKLSIGWQDYPSPDACAVLVFFTGCNHNCKGCSNPLLQNYSSGEDISANELMAVILEYCKRNNTNKVVFLGGDPLHIDNIDGVRELLGIIYDDKTLEVCIYTGYSKEFFESKDFVGFKYVKCGRFEKSLFVPSCKTDEYIQFASVNQKLYDSKYRLLSNNGKFYFKNVRKQHNIKSTGCNKRCFKRKNI